MQMHTPVLEHSPMQKEPLSVISLSRWFNEINRSMILITSREPFKWQELPIQIVISKDVIPF